MHFRADNCQISFDSDPALQYLDDIFVESGKDENEVLGAVLPDVVVKVFK